MSKRICIPVRKGAVALLGAGFSRSVGLPLMTELLGRSVPSDVIEIVRCLGGFGSDRAMGIEEFLTVCDFEDSIRLGGKRKNYSYISSFAAAIATSMFGMQKTPAFWNAVVDLLGSCESIISLNWDTLLEVQAHAIGKSIGYIGTRADGRMNVLKPHGSIDWYRASRIGELVSHKLFTPLFPGYVRYRPFSEEEHFFSVPHEFANLFNRVPPVIIAPTHLKAVPNGPLRGIWREAYNALESASDVIVIGYSMPPSDHLIRLMLQRAIRYQQILDFESAPRIIVVDPDSSGAVATRFSGLFGSYCHFIRRRFLEVRLVPAKGNNI